MDFRTILTSAVIGAVIGLALREFMQYGVAINHWGLGVPRGGEALLTGAIIGAVVQLTGRKGGRR